MLVANSKLYYPSLATPQRIQAEKWSSGLNYATIIHEVYMGDGDWNIDAKLQLILSKGIHTFICTSQAYRTIVRLWEAGERWRIRVACISQPPRRRMSWSRL